LKEKKKRKKKREKMLLLKLVFLISTLFVGSTICAETNTYTQTKTPASTNNLASQSFSNDDYGVLEGGQMSVTIYVGTIEDTETVQIFSITPPTPPTGYKLMGTAYSLQGFSSEPYLFNIPPMVRIQLSSSDVSSSTNDAEVGLYFRPVGLNWMLAPRSAYDPTTMKVTGYPDRDGDMAVFYGKITTSSDTQYKVHSAHPKHMPSKGVFALICMGAVAAIVVGALLYKRHQNGGGFAASSSSPAGRIANPVEKENEMSSKQQKKGNETAEYEAGGAGGGVAAAVAAKEKPKHSANARKSMKVEKLPKGWTEYVDDETGQFYYFEESSGQVQWTKPTK